MSQEEITLPREVLVVALVVAFGIFMPAFVVPPLEDVLTSQLQIGHAEASLLYSLPVAMLAVVAIPSGFLADSIGLKKAIGIGTVVLTIGSALRGIAGSFPVLVAFTLVYGLGLGMCFPNIPKLARHCSSRERSGFTVSIFTMGIIASGALGLAITRPVLYTFVHDYQGVFLLSTVPIFVGAGLWWFLVGDPPCAAAGQETAGADWQALRRVMVMRGLWLIAVLFLLHNFVLYTFAGWLPQYLMSIGASPDNAGLIASVMLWAGMVSVVLVGRLSTRLDRRKPLLWIPSMALIFLMYWALLINVPLSWVLVVLIGIATTIRFVTILSLPVQMVDPGQSGSASGMVMSVGYVGAVVGPQIGGYILDATGSYYWILLSLVIVSVLAVGVSFLVPETGPRAS